MREAVMSSPIAYGAVTIKTRHGSRLTDYDFTYKRSGETDVQETWRRHGWVQPDRRAQLAIALELNKLEEA